MKIFTRNLIILSIGLATATAPIMSSNNTQRNLFIAGTAIAASTLPIIDSGRANTSNLHAAIDSAHQQGRKIPSDKIKPIINDKTDLSNQSGYLLFGHAIASGIVGLGMLTCLRGTESSNTSIKIASYATIPAVSYFGYEWAKTYKNGLYSHNRRKAELEANAQKLATAMNSKPIFAPRSRARTPQNKDFFAVPEKSRLR